MRVRPVFRLLALVQVLVIFVALPFVLWGAWFESAFSVEETIARLRGTGWAWAAGIGLILSDIVLPVPSTAVMAALGVLYGPVLGGLISALGAILAGSLGYWLCRAFGGGLARRIAGANAIAEAQALFRRWGFGLIVISRWMPVLPETVAFMAGLIRVPFPRFLLALTAGSVPLGVVFATAGHLGREAPVLIIVLSALAPVALVLVVRLVRASTDG